MSLNFTYTNTVAMFLPIQFYKILKVSSVLHVVQLIFYLR